MAEIRTSARIKEVVRAAGVKPVDFRVRQQLLLRKLESFEQDNFDESCFDEPVEQNEDDLDEDVMVSRDSKRRKKRSGFGATMNKTSIRFQQLIQNELEVSSVSGGHVPTYFSANAGPSKYPPRKFCGACGNISKYRCVRCGFESCSQDCLLLHKETSIQCK